MREITELEKIVAKYQGKFLNKKEQLVFKKKFFKELFDPEFPIDYEARTTLFFNALLEEEDIPYRIYDCINEYPTEKGWRIVKIYKY